MVSVVLAGCSRVVGLAGGFGCGVKCLGSNHIDSVLVYLMMVLWFSRPGRDILKQFQLSTFNQQPWVTVAANIYGMLASHIPTPGFWRGNLPRVTVAANTGVLLITLYPRLPTGPNDNRCHLQVYRHFYVIAIEGRCVQTVDVDTCLPVYVPFEVTIKETHHYAETSFCEVTPCILPECALGDAQGLILEAVKKNEDKMEYSRVLHAIKADVAIVRLPGVGSNSR
nr:anaphase-promoting complex subunit 1 isoform X1 [Tanacetum cinerariifolium]